MFTKYQLDLLINLQSDDWHPEYFRSLVQSSNDKTLTQYLNRLSIEQIQDLQLAISFLSALPDVNP